MDLYVKPLARIVVMITVFENKNVCALKQCVCRTHKQCH